MMSLFTGGFALFLGVIVAIVFLVVGFVASRSEHTILGKMGAGGCWLLSITFLFLGIALSSVAFIESDKVGVLDKKWGGGTLSDGEIIARNGENGIQADILRAGVHFWLWSVQYEINQVPLTTIPQGSIGIIETFDGLPMPAGNVFAPEWPLDKVQNMLDAQNFLSDGGGFKGPQLTIIGPGTYAANPRLFNITEAPITSVPRGEVLVIKSNVEGVPSTLQPVFAELDVENAKYSNGTVKPGNIGVWGVPLPPGQYWLHPGAFEATTVDIRKQTIDFLDVPGVEGADTGAIAVKALDGFQFNIDVSVIYHIAQENASNVVSQIGEPERVKDLLVQQLRKIMRDRAGQVETLSYVNNRVEQQVETTRLLRLAMLPYGVAVDDVNIRNMYGDRLTDLLNTQTERQIAREQQLTYDEQRQAAEKQQELNKAIQQAEEERTLATREYDVLRAEQEKQQLIIQAEGDGERVRIAAQAEADKVRIEAEARASAIEALGKAEAERYNLIVTALGAPNATTIEIVDRIKETIVEAQGSISDIKLPEIFVSGSGNQSGGGLEAAILSLVTRQMNSEPAASN